MAFVLILLLLLVKIYKSTTLPKIYYTASAEPKPLITILAGTHGNESGPSFWLRDRIVSNPIHFDGYNMAIVPFVNPSAIALNRRSVVKDINRSWPNKHKINNYLLPWIHESSIIIDIHEGWGYNAAGFIGSGKPECAKHQRRTQSLGHSIYTNSPALYPTIDKAILALNRLTDKPCKKWVRLNHVPNFGKEGGTLDQYADIRGTPYILIELAGQNNKEPLKVRYKYLDTIFDSFSF